MLLIAFWPVTLALLLTGLGLMIWAAWQNRRFMWPRRVLLICLILEVLAPVVAIVVQRVTWRPYGDNFSVDPREAVIFSAMLGTMVAAFVVSMVVGIKQRTANHTPEGIRRPADGSPKPSR